MKRIKRIFYVVCRKFGRKFYLKLYYWSDLKCYETKNIYLFPNWYYKILFKFCMLLVNNNKAKHFADKAIHTIPYHLRFSFA